MRDVGNWAENGVENRKGAGQVARGRGENKVKLGLKRIEIGVGRGRK